MPQIKFRLYAPKKGLIAHEDQLVYRFRADGYLIDDLVAHEEASSHSFSKADVVLTQELSRSDGNLKFIGPWEEHPASLQLWLPLEDALRHFIDAHDFTQAQLLLCVELAAPSTPTPSLHFGGGGSELWWHTSGAEKLAAKVEWLAPDNDA